MATGTSGPVERLKDMYRRDLGTLCAFVDQVIEVSNRARMRGDDATADELLALVAEVTQHLRGGTA